MLIIISKSESNHLYLHKTLRLINDLEFLMDYPLAYIYSIPFIASL